MLAQIHLQGSGGGAFESRVWAGTDNPQRYIYGMSAIKEREEKKRKKHL